MLCNKAERCAVPVAAAVYHIHQPVAVILVHRVKLRIGIEGYAPVIRGMAIDGHRDPQADTEVIKDNGCLSGVSDTVTPAHRSAFVNQEPYCQPLFIGWEPGSDEERTVLVMEGAHIQPPSIQKVLLLSAFRLLF